MYSQKALVAAFCLPALLIAMLGASIGDGSPFAKPVGQVMTLLTGTVNAASSSYTVTGLEFTTLPASNSWLLAASLDVTIPNGSLVTCSLFDAGALISGTERSASGDGGTLSATSRQELTLLYMGAVAPVLPLDVRCKSSFGTAVLGQRALYTLLPP